jgi:hypothetical protein
VKAKVQSFLLRLNKYSWQKHVTSPTATAQDWFDVVDFLEQQPEIVSQMKELSVVKPAKPRANNFLLENLKAHVQNKPSLNSTIYVLSLPLLLLPL